MREYLEPNRLQCISSGYELSPLKAHWSANSPCFNAALMPRSRKRQIVKFERAKKGSTSSKVVPAKAMLTINYSLSKLSGLGIVAARKKGALPFGLV